MAIICSVLCVHETERPQIKCPLQTTYANQRVWVDPFVHKGWKFREDKEVFLNRWQDANIISPESHLAIIKQHSWLQEP